MHSSYHKATGFWFSCGRLFLLPERCKQKFTAVLVMFFLLNEMGYIGLNTWAIANSHVGNCREGSDEVAKAFQNGLHFSPHFWKCPDVLIGIISNIKCIKTPFEKNCILITAKSWYSAL